MQHLHACGVLHRDLKSDNALVQARDPLVVKWADFGCSVKLRGGAKSAVGVTYGKGVVHVRVHVGVGAGACEAAIAEAACGVVAFIA